MLVKLCPTCGKRFEADDDELVYCSLDCYKGRNKKRRHPDEVQRNYDSLKAKKRKDRDEAERRRARLAKRDAAERRSSYLARRDAEYAKLGTRVVVDCVKTTDGRTLVVETRGQRCIGWRSCGHVSHT